MEAFDVLLAVVGVMVLLGSIITIVKMKSQPEKIIEQYQSSKERGDIFVKKYKEASTEYYKGPILRLGLIGVMAVLTMAFNVTNDRHFVQAVTVVSDVEDWIVDIEDVPVTVHSQPKRIPPPVVVNPIIEIIDDEPLVPDEPIILDDPEVDPIIEKQPLAIVTIPAVVDDPDPDPILESDEKDTFIIVEEMPEYPGGDRALLKYLAQNIRYPNIAQENGITGRVFVRFVINEVGNISDANVLRDIGGGCGAEAVRAIKKMPKWKPGKQRGRAVKVYYTLPVNFDLED